jgi:hypothetical protein
VLIGKVNVTDLLTCENFRNVSFGAGRCSLIAADPDRTQYNLFQDGQELEIYMSETTTANKVWGGYVENKQLSENDGRALKVEGREYSSRLMNQTFSDTFASTELSDAVTTIMGYQTDFTVSIDATSGKSVDGTFTNESIYSALQKFCDAHGYYFWVDVNKVFRMSPYSTVELSPDTITAGDNVTKERFDLEDKQYLVNDVTVRGTSGVEGTATDATSQATYGIHSKKVTVASLDNAATAQRYADQYIEDYKDPLPNQRLTTKFLPSTDPREYLAVSIPGMGLSGNYQVVSIGHRWGKGQGLRSEVELSNKLADTGLQMGQFERRIGDIETATY